MLWIFAAVILLAFLLWMQQHRQMRNAFKAMSFDVLEQSSKTFLQLAETHFQKLQEGARIDLDARKTAIEASLEPFRASMKQLDEQQRALEQRREGAYVGLQKQLEQMVLSDRELRQETVRLVHALRSPNLRGAWGEVHLRRVVELAGLVNHCDFLEQTTLTADGKSIRPDLIVRLPQDRHIAVDAKTPLHSYLEACQENLPEEQSAQHLRLHASALRRHIKELSSKEYWKHFERSPEYVILFLPAEAFFSAALQADPTLIEVGAEQNVVIATPTTLIAILRAVAFGWKQEGLSKSAAEIARTGAELYERLEGFCEHWSRTGKQLSSVVESYNKSVGSFESRVLPSVKKLREQSGVSQELVVSDAIEKLVRELRPE